MTLSTIINMRMLSVCCLVLMMAAGCGSGGQRADTSTAANTAIPTPAAADVAQDQNACHLLTREEVSALVEEKIVMSDQTDAGETWSTCEWEGESVTARFMLTVYWANGKQEWETWRAAQGFSEQVLKQAEGVSPGDVVKQGPVAGIGDAAYFSELLPSLVLKGDVLFEMNLFFAPRAETKFASLARKLLAKIE